MNWKANAITFTSLSLVYKVKDLEEIGMDWNTFVVNLKQNQIQVWS